MYTIKFIDVCSDSTTFNKDCSYGVMKMLNLNTDAVDTCVNSATKAATSRGQVTIPFFEEDKAMAKKLGIILHPAVTVNNITYRGEIDGYNVFKAICAGFLNQPDVCKGDKVFAALAIQGNGGLATHSFDLVRVYHIIAAVLLVLIINLVALYMYRKF